MLFPALKARILKGSPTEAYPLGELPKAPSAFTGLPAWHQDVCQRCGHCGAACPTGAIEVASEQHSPACEWELDIGKCIMCGLCIDACPQRAISATGKYDLAQLSNPHILGDAIGKRISRLYKRSLHIRHVDVGSCNACDWEMNALLNPVYDIQRLGIDFVASPRHADMLMVTGSPTANLAEALRLTYEAAPQPCLVMALGTCAISGGLFAQAAACQNRVNQYVPVHVYVPGCPPRPQAILHGLWLLLERAEQLCMVDGRC